MNTLFVITLVVGAHIPGMVGGPKPEPFKHLGVRRNNAAPEKSNEVRELEAKCKFFGDSVLPTPLKVREMLSDPAFNVDVLNQTRSPNVLCHIIQNWNSGTVAELEAVKMLLSVPGIDTRLVCVVSGLASEPSVFQMLLDSTTMSTTAGTCVHTRTRIHTWACMYTFTECTCVYRRAYVRTYVSTPRRMCV